MNTSALVDILIDLAVKIAGGLVVAAILERAFGVSDWVARLASRLSRYETEAERDDQLAEWRDVLKAKDADRRPVGALWASLGFLAGGLVMGGSRSGKAVWKRLAHMVRVVWRDASKSLVLLSLLNTAGAVTAFVLVKMVVELEKTAPHLWVTGALLAGSQLALFAVWRYRRRSGTSERGQQAD